MITGFGGTLKEWRNKRRMSQLDLGLSANVSARHISFLETGRANPSQSMVVRLSEELDVPRSIRNQWLLSAGFAPSYRERGLDEAEMTPVRKAVEWMLSRHDPYPAMALDRHWSVVQANKSGQLMLTAAGLGEGDNLLNVVTDPELMDSLFVNPLEVAHHSLTRLRTESSHLGGDAILDEAADRLLRAFGPELNNLSGMPIPAFIPAQYRLGAQTLSLFTTIAQFGTAEDIALAELKIELFFPADEASQIFLNALPYATDA